MFRKRLLVRALLVLGLAVGTHAIGTAPSQADYCVAGQCFVESCWHVQDTDLGYHKVCHPVP
jgi:hypothetical protein